MPVEALVVLELEGRLLLLLGVQRGQEVVGGAAPFPRPRRRADRPPPATCACGGGRGLRRADVVAALGRGTPTDPDQTPRTPPPPDARASCVRSSLVPAGTERRTFLHHTPEDGCQLVTASPDTVHSRTVRPCSSGLATRRRGRRDRGERHRLHPRRPADVPARLQLLRRARRTPTRRSRARPRRHAAARLQLGPRLGDLGGVRQRRLGRGPPTGEARAASTSTASSRLVAECDRHGIVVNVTLSRGNGATGPARLQGTRRPPPGGRDALPRPRRTGGTGTSTCPTSGTSTTSGTPRIDDLAELRDAAQGSRPDAAGHRLARRRPQPERRGAVPRGRSAWISCRIHRPPRRGLGRRRRRSRDEAGPRLDEGARTGACRCTTTSRSAAASASGSRRPRTSSPTCRRRRPAAPRGGASTTATEGRPRDGRPRRSFDLREKALFEQLDDEERKFMERIKPRGAVLATVPAWTPRRSGQTGGRVGPFQRRPAGHPPALRRDRTTGLNRMLLALRERDHRRHVRVAPGRKWRAEESAMNPSRKSRRRIPASHGAASRSRSDHTRQQPPHRRIAFHHRGGRRPRPQCVRRSPRSRAAAAPRRRRRAGRGSSPRAARRSRGRRRGRRWSA